MIKRIINGIFNLVISLVSVILAPIDAIITNALPGLSNILNYIGNFFGYVGNTIPFIASWLHLPTEFVSFVIAYFTFKLTVPYAISTVKLAIKWYDKLKI